MREIKSLYTRASAAMTSTTASSDITTDGFNNINLTLNVTAVSGTSPTLDVAIQRKMANGAYVTVHSLTQITTATNASVSVDVGPDAVAANKKFVGDTFRINYTIAGTSPSFTFSAEVNGFRY